jgi:hypothetical protein
MLLVVKPAEVKTELTDELPIDIAVVLITTLEPKARYVVLAVIV